MLCMVDNCNWRMHASCLSENVTFMVKTMSCEHICIISAENNNPNENTKWIAEKLKEFLEVDPKMSYDLMEKEMKEKWRIKP